MIIEKLMYKRLYIFLNNNNIIFNLQLGFRQQYSTSHALMNMTKNIRKAIDNENIGCGVFVALQKAFDTVDNILVGNIMLMIFPLNRIEQALFFSKCKNTLVLKHYNHKHFQPKNSHNSSLFKQNAISKFQDKNYLGNILFACKSLNNLTPSVFSTRFSFSSDQHNCETSYFTQGNLTKLFYKTN